MWKNGQTTVKLEAFADGHRILEMQTPTGSHGISPGKAGSIEAVLNKRIEDLQKAIDRKVYKQQILQQMLNTITAPKP